MKRLCFVMFLSELNQLELWRTDIGNADLEAYTKEILFIVAGPEFHELDQNTLVMYKALWGKIIAGTCWHDRPFDVLQDMSFVPSEADPVVWMRSAKDESCYEYIAVYMDDFAIATSNLRKLLTNFNTSTTSS